MVVKATSVSFGHDGLYNGWRRIGAMNGENWRNVVLRDPCVYCGGESQNREHVVPDSQGGKDGAHNIVGACKSCNSRRGSQSMLLFWRNRNVSPV